MKVRPDCVAVIGFGSQGSAQAVRLQRAGLSVCVGLPPRSKSRRRARQAGFSALMPRRAVAGADTVVILVPDQHGSAVLAELAEGIQAGALVVFAAGFPLTFPAQTLPEHCDIVLVAPHGPGRDLVAGTPVSGFVGVHQDVSGRAMARARAYARVLGLRPVYETTPHDEAMGDLFGEQALLCGGLLTLTAAVAGIMIRRGLAPENAFFETVAQLDRLAVLLKQRGVQGFWDEISDCAAAGATAAADRIVSAHTHADLERLYDDIEAGEFAETLYREGRPARWPAAWRVLAEMEKAVKGRGGR